LKNSRSEKQGQTKASERDTEKYESQQNAS
jgi:hypothetical protein